MADLYSVLGVPRTADEAALKRAYRKLAKLYHPDRNKGDEKAAEQFKKVNAAYDILSDSKRKGAYDRGEIDEEGNPKFRGFEGGFGAGGPGARSGFGGGGFGAGGARGNGGHFEFDLGGDGGDFFSELFGRNKRGHFRAPPRKGADISYRLSIPFVDAALAASVRLTLRQGKTIDLRVPPGVEEGSRIRLAGQGEPAGPNQGAAGDAIVSIVIEPDRRFQRRGDDIETDIQVPLKTAVLGGRQRVETPDGEVLLNIAPRTNSGKVMRLKGRGWTKRDGKRGDLLARVLVMVPDDPELAAFLGKNGPSA